jgi:uncharacterized repeat protein (TIGR01451 family)
VDNPAPQLGSNAVLTVTVSNAAGWSAATGVRVKDALVDDSTSDKVFKYTLGGASVESWTISGGGGSPTGITIDPTNVNHLLVVDKGTDRVYQFSAGASRTSGSQSAASSFPLGSGNSSPEGIADPPPASNKVAAHSPLRSSDQVSSAQAFDLALLAVMSEIDGLSGRSRRKK